MTESERRKIVQEVYEEIKDHGLTIDQLENTDSVVNSDYIELNGGRKVTLSTLKEYVRGFGIILEIIGKGDANIPTDINVFSSLRTLAEISNNNNLLKEIFLRKDQEDTTKYPINVGEGATDSLESGKGTIITPDKIQADTIEARYAAIFREVIFNRISAQEGDVAYSDNGLIDSITLASDGTYTLALRKRWDNDFTSFKEGDILYGEINNLFEDGTYYTSWMRVNSVNTTANTISVTMYSDSNVPGGKNYAPQELMKLVRRGNATDTNRQSYWYLSATEEKCFVWLEGVDKPIIEESNYYMMLGRPKNLSLFTNLPINYNQAAIFARAGIFQNLFRVKVDGNPVKDILPGVQWVQGTKYKSSETEADTVYHYGCRWQCIVDETTQEPKYGATDWAMIEGNPEFTIEIESTNGWYFEPSELATTLMITGKLYNQDVTSDILDADVSWTRDTGEAAEDNAWAVLRANAGKNLDLTVDDLGPNYMTKIGCKFKATVTMRDGTSATNYITF